MSDWPRYYILSGRLPVAVDMWTWARMYERSDRKVADERIGNRIRVSTVFLGLDHNFRGGEPVLFETMIFGGPLNGEMWRYCTYDEAERGHAEAVAAARIASAKVDAIADAAGAKP